MGSDPQSMLEWDDQNCRCYAGRERPGLLKRIAELEKKLADSELLGEAVLENVEKALPVDRHERWVAENLKEPCKTCPANHHTTFDYDKCSACVEKTPFKKKRGE